MKRSTSGTALGTILLLIGVFFAGYEIFTRQVLFGVNYITSAFMIIVGFFFFIKARKGKSASHLLTKEDIGRFTILGSFRNHLIVIFAVFGFLFLLILLIKSGII